MGEERIIDYRIVEYSSKQKLEDAVNELVYKYYYEPIGGISVYVDREPIEQRYYCQAMILRDSPKEEKFKNLEREYE